MTQQFLKFIERLEEKDAFITFQEKELKVICEMLRLCWNGPLSIETEIELDRIAEEVMEDE